jgi:hypothetical protein
LPQVEKTRLRRPAAVPLPALETPPAGPLPVSLPRTPLEALRQGKEARKGANPKMLEFGGGAVVSEAKVPQALAAAEGCWKKGDWVMVADPAPKPARSVTALTLALSSGDAIFNSSYASPSYVTARLVCGPTRG